MIVKLLLIFWTFFKIGLFTIGGGYAMIPMIQSEVIAKGWVTEEQLYNFLAISESTPGPFAINIATFIGASQEGFLGALFATIGVILPSFIIILIIFHIYQKFIQNRFVNGAMSGVKAVVIGTIAVVAGRLIWKEIFKNEVSFMKMDWRALVIMSIIGLFLLIGKKKVSPILLIVISAGLGILFYGVLQ